MAANESDPPLELTAGDGKPPTSPPAAHASGIGTPLPKIIPFNTLARCGDEIWIENDGQIYRLRKTRQGKLILTK